MDESGKPAASTPASVSPKDLVILGYLAIELGLVLAAGPATPHWPVFIAGHVTMIAAIIGLRRVARWSAPCGSRAWVRILHDWYPLLYVPVIFIMLGPLVPAVHPIDRDAMLLDWDRQLFGGHPGAWFDPLATPFGIELLRACWLSYFFFPVAVAIVLWRRAERRIFEEYVLALVLGWLISYLGYFMVPALGPGYRPDLIPAPAAVSAPGASRIVAQWLFSLEGTKRDIFPSGHTMIALLVAWQAYRHKVRGRVVLVPLVAGLIIATVTLRYHYGVDVAAGVLLTLAIVPVVRIWVGHTMPRAEI